MAGKKRRETGEEGDCEVGDERFGGGVGGSCGDSHLCVCVCVCVCGVGAGGCRKSGGQTWTRRAISRR